ncbi:MAG: hypothetical protein GX569_04550 [Candidatus Riflebacteria bacterium]|nr:hypothetical protein [Candidatus Riflebacteria bacterium]
MKMRNIISVRTILIVFLLCLVMVSDAEPLLSQNQFSVVPGTEKYSNSFPAVEQDKDARDFLYKKLCWFLDSGLTGFNPFHADCGEDPYVSMQREDLANDWLLITGCYDGPGAHDADFIMLRNKRMQDFQVLYFAESGSVFLSEYALDEFGERICVGQEDGETRSLLKLAENNIEFDKDFEKSWRFASDYLQKTLMPGRKFEESLFFDHDSEMFGFEGFEKDSEQKNEKCIALIDSKNKKIIFKMQKIQVVETTKEVNLQ